MLIANKVNISSWEWFPIGEYALVPVLSFHYRLEFTQLYTCTRILRLGFKLYSFSLNQITR